MRISLDSGSTAILEGGTHEVHKKDASKHIGKSTATVIDNSDGDKTTITTFEDMLNESALKLMQGSDNDKITQASDLSVKKLAKLYNKLGIKSAAGKKGSSYDFVAKMVKKAVADKTDDASTSNDNAVGNNDSAVKSVSVSENKASTGNNASVSSAQSASKPTATHYVSNSTDKSYTVPKSQQPYFREAAEKTGVAYELLTAVACAESDFNNNCTSKSGAMGIMQLMPETAKYLGVKDAYDPEQNIMGGSRYLAEKLKEHGSVKLALAAYNAGSNAVEKYGGVPPYTETQNYIKRILGYLGTDGSESGFDKIYKSMDSDNTDNFKYVAAPDAVPDGTVIQIGENTSMSYASYLKYVDLIS